MKWIGQHIWNLVSRFYSDVYLDDISSGTIASGGNLGLDSNNKIVKATSSSVTLAGTPDYITISGSEITRNQIDLAADVTGVLPSANLDSDTAHLGTTQTFTGTKTFGALTNFLSSTNNAPDLTINSTSNNGLAGKVHFFKDRADGSPAAGNILGTVQFDGENDTPANLTYATITGSIESATTNNEGGILTFQVANHDGDLGTGLLVSGGSENNEIDVLIGLGANSIVEIPGNIDLGGDIDVDGTLETDALTIGGAAVLAQATSSAVGAVELATDAEAITGTDTARAVTPANLKARVSQIINLKGYTADLKDGVYEFANPYNTDDEAPFQMQTSYGSGTISVSTKINQKHFFRSGSFHVPFACTIATIQTQISCANAGNVSIAIVEYIPSDDNQNDYPRTVYETVVNASDDNNNKVDTVTIATGDLDATAVAAGSHIMMMVKGDGTSAGASMTVISAAIGLSW